MPPSSDHATLLLDIFQRQSDVLLQLGTLSANVNTLLIESAKADEKRGKIYDKIEKLEQRVSVLERAHAWAQGATWSAKVIWLSGAGATGAGATWLVTRFLA